MANPNPSPETRFGAERGPKNPGGKTKEQVQAEREAARKSAILRDKMLSAIMEKVSAGEDVLEYLKADTLKLFKDSEDRAGGMPDQTVNANVNDGAAKLRAYVESIAERCGDAGEPSAE